MKHAAIILLAILSSACATLDVAEIRDLDRQPFDPLQLKPSWETHNLRIDVLRQTYSTGTDSTSSTEDAPYHPIGFDIGNGLFYDLNGNVTLRLDALLGYEPGSDFEVREISRPGRKGRVVVHRFHGDSLTFQNIRRDKARYVNHLRTTGDSLRYMRRRNMKFAIVETDTALLYTGKKRKRDAIYSSGNNRYYVNKDKKRNVFQLSDSQATLGRKYIIGISPDHRNVTISTYRKRRPRLLYTLIHDEKRLLIYNKNYNGIRIEKGGDGINLNRNRRLLARYELVDALHDVDGRKAD